VNMTLVVYGHNGSAVRGGVGGADPSKGCSLCQKLSGSIANAVRPCYGGVIQFLDVKRSILNRLCSFRRTCINLQWILTHQEEDDLDLPAIHIDRTKMLSAVPSKATVSNPCYEGRERSKRLTTIGHSSPQPEERTLPYRLEFMETSLETADKASVPFKHAQQPQLDAEAWLLREEQRFVRREEGGFIKIPEGHGLH